jgi:hypothetical protein
MRLHLDKWLGTVAYAYHFSYAGKYKKEDCGPGSPKHKVRPYLKNNHHEKDWWSGK